MGVPVCSKGSKGIQIGLWGHIIDCKNCGHHTCMKTYPKIVPLCHRLDLVPLYVLMWWGTKQDVGLLGACISVLVLSFIRIRTIRVLTSVSNFVEKILRELPVVPCLYSCCLLGLTCIIKLVFSCNRPVHRVFFNFQKIKYGRRLGNPATNHKVSTDDFLKKIVPKFCLKNLLFGAFSGLYLIRLQ